MTWARDGRRWVGRSGRFQAVVEPITGGTWMWQLFQLVEDAATLAIRSGEHRDEVLAMRAVEKAAEFERVSR